VPPLRFFARVLVAAALATAALPPGVVRAQEIAEDTEQRAAARKQAGDEAMEALRFADALAAYGDAYTLKPDPALLYNMGRALQALNRFPEALDKLEAFEAQASDELKGRVPGLAKRITELRERVSTLTVQTDVPGARILVRDSVVGKAPLPAPIRLTAGRATVEVEAEGYFPSKQTVELPGGGALTVQAKLFSRTTTGILSVRASAKGAEVLVDGKRVGIAPVDTNVSSGNHKVLVRHPEHRDYDTTAVVAAGSTRTVVADLQSPSPLTRWWFWSGVGVVALAGVAVGIVATTERSPDKGTLGQMSAPNAASGTPVLFRF
jgi:hypothetical protein